MVRARSPEVSGLKKAITAATGIVAATRATSKSVSVIMSAKINS
jgi:hypothetical protein